VQNIFTVHRYRDFCVGHFNLNHPVDCFALLASPLQVDAGSDSRSDNKKSRFNRKHVIIAVTCAVVILIVITGIVVGVKFFLDSSTEIVKVFNLLYSTSRVPCSSALYSQWLLYLPLGDAVSSCQ